jgi:hypothetical protein
MSMDRWLADYVELEIIQAQTRMVLSIKAGRMRNRQIVQ